MNLFLTWGMVWPFALAAVVVVAASAGVELSENVALGLFFAALFGLPAVGALLYRQMPAGWSADRRALAAAGLALPVLAGQWYLAGVLGFVGLAALGRLPM